MNNYKTQNKIYTATLTQGRYEDYYETIIFATFDKNKAEAWVDRFNRIIKENEERIFNSDEDYFWNNFIRWENPIAIVQEFEVR
jgi:hypothetical protein